MVRRRRQEQNRRRDSGAVDRGTWYLLRDRFTIELAAGGSLEAQGSILDHEYQIHPRRHPGGS
jgi:uncharacterized protein YxjI